jgi:6,7-dimethyl-8-ribityllumazine synthase
MEVDYDYESPVIQGVLDTDRYTRESARKTTLKI